MNNFTLVFFCSMLLLGATTIGSLIVLFITKINKKLELICLGLASGVMFAASIWSLLLPSIELTNFFIVLLGFILGTFIIIKLDKLVIKYSGLKDKKNSLLFMAMTIHNIPEGMIVGLTSALAFSNNSSITISSAILLAIGIAIQNIPEGASISLTYYQNGYSKFKSILLGFISGIVEPISAFIMFFLKDYLNGILPLLLSLAAGVMIYVVVDELLPNEKENNYGSLAFVIGFLIMMSLDILL